MKNLKISKPYQRRAKRHFVGREFELGRLNEIDSRNSAQVIAVYGRRRVGKTELIEHYFSERTALKFEGIQLQHKDFLDKPSATQTQIQVCLKRLAEYVENDVVARLTINNWGEFFDLLTDIAQHNDIVLYFEEIQWLACYSTEFFSYLKPYWDDYWQHNHRLRIVLCGSSPSFLVSQFSSQSAMYGRSINELHLKEFSLKEAHEFMGTSYGSKEVLDAVLTVGGIPEYLDKLTSEPSVFLGLTKNAFQQSSYFYREFERIFVSSLSDSKYYKNAIRFLGVHRHATREEIHKGLTSGTIGGDFSKILDDLVTCEFVCKYTPLHLSTNSKLIRYTLADQYLQFYFTFIAPRIKNIERGEYNKKYVQAINRATYTTMMGHTFERWCRRYAHVLAKVMAFDQINYSDGAFFSRKTDHIEKGFQIDLMYIRDDHRIVVCEIKSALSQGASSLSSSLWEKISLFKEALPKYKKYSFETAIIVADSIDKTPLLPYFDHQIGLDDLFDSKVW